MVVTMLIWGLISLLGVNLASASAPYKGSYIGRLSTLEHDVTGDVYAVNNITLFIEGFTYDGEAPDAFFFAGNKDEVPSTRGFIIPDEKGRKDVLGPYNRKNLVLKFPITKKGQRSLNDVQWFSVWCRKFAIDFGHVRIARDLVKPAPQVAVGLENNKPLVKASTVTILDTDTIKIDDFSFDPTVQDAIFVMGSGNARASGSQVPDERGSTQPLTKYNRDSLLLDIPRELRGQPIQYFGVWSPTKGMLSSVTFDPNALIPPSLNSLPK
ncbi:protein Skeletor, isoforms B/C-like isoform X2 [Panulirus ornatus]|uniref:protein Skeletor, isoforms B/C-like isoform X2 n=1 Tax=Panulirus ornatus TaxID=150431 RepID=UPI003A8A4743